MPRTMKASLRETRRPRIADGAISPMYAGAPTITGQKEAAVPRQAGGKVKARNLPFPPHGRRRPTINPPCMAKPHPKP